MFEIHVTVSCPDLLAAAQLLVKRINPEYAEPPTPPVTPTPASAATPSTFPISATNAVESGQSAVPTNTLVVPLAQAPTYTMPQIAKAGADLISQNPGLLPRVNALLAQYGVQAVTDVKPEHYGAFATALRGMGAKI